MIKEWQYNNAGGRRDEIKKYISDNNLKTIDIGASAMYWSYPECKFVADSFQISMDEVTFFNINLENKTTWSELLNYVEINGKFDFSICSHTLEDVFNPTDLINLITEISNGGFIAMPSKYDEFSFLFGNDYRGNAHHKHIFDIKNDELLIFPKFSWIERNKNSDDLIKDGGGTEISFTWENKIPFKIFGDGVPFKSDGDLINNFYNALK